MGFLMARTTGVAKAAITSDPEADPFKRASCYYCTEACG